MGDIAYSRLTTFWRFPLFVQIGIVMLCLNGWAALLFPAWWWGWLLLLQSLVTVFVYVDIDEQLLWTQSQALSEKTWRQALDIIPFRTYIKYQQPFFTIWLSRCQWQLLAQGIMLILTGNSLASLWTLHPLAAMSFLAAPGVMLYGTMIAHDTMALSLALVGLSLGWPVIGSWLFGLACIVKYPVTIFLPMLYLRYRFASGWALMPIGLYWLWASTWRGSRQQAQQLQAAAKTHAACQCEAIPEDSPITRVKNLVSRNRFANRYAATVLVLTWPLWIVGNAWTLGYGLALLLMRVPPKYYLLLWLTLWQSQTF